MLIGYVRVSKGDDQSTKAQKRAMTEAGRDRRGPDIVEGAGQEPEIVRKGGPNLRARPKLRQRNFRTELAPLPENARLRTRCPSPLFTTAGA